MNALLLAVPGLLLYDIFMVTKFSLGAKAMGRLAPLHLPLVLLAGIPYALLLLQELRLQPLSVIGVIPIILGAILGAAGISSLRSQTIRPGSKLVTKGVYAHLRNPMYLSVLLVAIGTIFFTFSWRVVAYVALLAISFFLIIKVEERELSERFGGGYEEYRKRVPALIPCR